MTNRPKLHLPLTATDKVLEVTSYLLLIILWGFAIYSYQNSPDIVPTHFNGSGDVDGYGDSASVFGMAGVCTLLFILLTFLTGKPHLFNYPTEITPDNALKQYTNATRLLRAFKIAIPLIFICIEYSSFEVAIGDSEELGKGYILMIFALVYIPVLYFLARSSSASDKKS
ncbi:DUF1648 domain-containing protein [Flavobacterium zepuense]|uniref:DUF1648 domain-containing protein n=1 Tax=Flavobacterium zepuense TaxID=2593302 RepID=A0A552UZG8_9FLAO|nr:DUF1648 domain-containing protein [Flavobacterium zepuense]TRW23582.1 DUF1648 domain-containing protein [Flavobacterium zepuense]